MTSSVIELSKRLQRSLDSNYNVIDLVAVFEIIRVLEGTPITTEQLETTRLAKYINQLRRKTTNEQLARQAKNLLKKWRDNLMPAIASGSQPPPATAAVAPVTTMTNGLPTATVRSSQPTTPSRPVLQQTHHSNLNHHNNTTAQHQQQGANTNSMTGSCEKVAVINLVDEGEDQDSKSSLGASRPKHVSNVVTNHNHHRIGNNSNSNSGTGGGTALIGGPGLTIPTELTNFYLKNKKIIDGSDVRGVVPTKTTTPIKEEPHTVDTNNYLAEEMEVGDVDARDGKHKRKGRKKGAKGFDSLLGSSQTNLFSSNSNSGFADGGSSTMHPTTTAASTVGKKVKTTRQLVAEMKFRNEQNLRQASYPDLSNDQEHNNNNNNNGLSSSPLSMASNDSQQHHLFNHHHHNQHGGHDLVFHSAPVTPSGYPAAVKREDGQDQELSASARKREKKRRKLEKEQAAAAASKKVKAKVKREKTPPPVSGLNFLNQVDEDIWQLKRRLPPIDRKAILRQMKAESQAQVQADRHCTCEMVECSQEEAEKAAGVVYASLDDIPDPLIQPVDPTIEDSSSSVVPPVVGSKSALEVKPSTSSTVPVPPVVNVVRNKRSIFDMDDDVVMDEDPSPAAIDKNNNSEEEGAPTAREERFPNRHMIHPPVIDHHPQMHHQQAHPPPIPVVIAVPVGPGGDEEVVPEEEERHYYKFIDSPGCPVKRRQDDLIRINPDYHLAALHQLYVPGVNGNWSTFRDLDILKYTQRDQMKAIRASTRKAAKEGKTGIKSRKRKRDESSSEDDEDSSDDEDMEDPLYSSSNSNNLPLLTCWERLQDVDTSCVESVVPSVNPFFYFLKATDEEEERRQEQVEREKHLLLNMAGRLPRYVPLRTDFGMVIVPPEMPPPPVEGEEGQPQEVAKVDPPPPIQFNRELAKEMGIEKVCEGLKGDVYDPVESSKFLEAMLRQRLPKFQQANLFYKRSWPGAEDRGSSHLSLELLNSLYLNRVLEFRRRRRRRRRNNGTSGQETGINQHRKRRRKSDGQDEEEDVDGDDKVEVDEEEEEEVEVADVHVFDGFLEMQTMAFRNSSNSSSSPGQEGMKNGNNNSNLVVRSARRLFYVNDDRLFGHQPSILDDIDTATDPLPLLDDWDLFRVRWQSMEFLPPVLSATARVLYSSWPRMRWNFLLDYFKARDQDVEMDVSPEDEEEEGGEVVRIHENNFRLPSFNQLTEENLLGIRQRRGRRRRMMGQGDEEEDEEDEPLPSALPSKVTLQVESYRERDFVQVCMDKWPQLFEGMSFDYEEGVLSMRHEDLDTRWRFMGEFRELLKEVTRLGVAGEEEDDVEGEEEGQRGKNGFNSSGTTVRVKREVGGSDGEEDVEVDALKLRPVDEPHVELFKEWHESVQVQSYNDELLTILPYVVID